MEEEEKEGEELEKKEEEAEEEKEGEKEDSSFELTPVEPLAVEYSFFAFVLDSRVPVMAGQALIVHAKVTADLSPGRFQVANFALADDLVLSDEKLQSTFPNLVHKALDSP